MGSVTFFGEESQQPKASALRPCFSATQMWWLGRPIPPLGFEQFESLGFPLSRSAIAIVDEATGTVEFWPHMKDYTGPEVLRLSAEELENGSSPRMQKDLEAMREAREQGEPHYIFELVGAEEIIEYNRDMKELFNLRN